MRLAGLILAALLCPAGALAQTVTPNPSPYTNSAPTANHLANAEVALHCTEILARAEEAMRTGDYTVEFKQRENGRLEPIRIRYGRNLGSHTTLAGYTAEQTAGRAALHRQRVAKLLEWQVQENIGSCARGEAVIGPVWFADPPKAGHAFAMAGKGPNDVLYVDIASLYRNGPMVQGWQLYVFKADQTMDGKAGKAQWAPFRADCARASMTTYGSMLLGDLRTGGATLVDKRGNGSMQRVAPNTFGAATWLLACEVNDPPQMLPSLAAAADDTARQFGVQ